MPYDPTGSSHILALVFLPLFVVSTILIVAYKMSYDETLTFNWRSWVNRINGRSEFIFAQFQNIHDEEEHNDQRRIIISHSPIDEQDPATTSDYQEEEEIGIEMVAGGPEEKTVLAKDLLDELVETISTTESVNLISDM